MIAVTNPPDAPKPASPIMLDVEASGFGRGSYPIEVGYCMASGQTFCTLIRPEPEWVHWDANAEQVHHIARDLLLAKGRAVHEVAGLLNAQLLGQTVYSDGWANDYSWIGALFDAANLTPRFKLANLRSLLSDVQADQWHTVKQTVLQELGAQRHRASTDARVLQLTLQRVRVSETAGTQTANPPL
jgi:hypothetical protein